jgi:lipoprotein-releasing system permease protein
MFELDIARRHVATNRRGSAFTMISVSIAVGIIIMSLGLTEGVRVQILENTIEKNAHLIINPKKTESYINMYRTLSETMANYPGVLSVSPRLVGQGAACFQDRVAGVEFIGVHPFQENRLMAVQESMISGNLSDLIFNKKGAFLGVKLAESLKIRPGGDFHLYFKNKSVRLKVIGLLEKGTVKDETIVYISLDTAQELIGQGDVVSEIGVKLANFADAPALAREMNGKSPYKTNSWQDFSKEIARFVGNQNVTNMLLHIHTINIGICNSQYDDYGGQQTKKGDWHSHGNGGG